MTLFIVMRSLLTDELILSHYQAAPESFVNLEFSPAGLNRKNSTAFKYSSNWTLEARFSPVTFRQTSPNDSPTTAVPS